LLADFEQVLVPTQVWQEVTRHRPQALSPTDFPLQNIPVEISVAASFQTLARTLSLGLGEQAALSLMARQSQAIFLTDDAAARLAAVTLGYQVHGTIGILLRAIRRRQRSRREVLDILHRLPAQSSLHIRPALLQDIITQLQD